MRDNIWNALIVTYPFMIIIHCEEEVVMIVLETYFFFVLIIVSKWNEIFDKLKLCDELLLIFSLKFQVLLVTLKF